MPPSAPIGTESAPAGEPSSKSPWAWCRVLGQVGGLYVVLETEDGLVLMDPHTAAELSHDQIWRLVDDLIEAHGALLPTYQ